MSYSSGDWTARKYYLSSGLLKDKAVVGCCGPQPPIPSTMPFFPVYGGTPASMNFATAGPVDISGSYATLCFANLTTDVSGRFGIWAEVQSSGDPVTIKIYLGDFVVTQSYFSPYVFYGSEVLPAGTYTAILEASTVGQVYITSANLMIVGQLT